MDSDLLFKDWESLARIVGLAICSYVALVIMLRVAGKRTLSRFNAFDLVISMALGSILAKIILTPDISLAESLTALAILIVLHVITARLETHWPLFRRLINSPPVVVYYQGEYMHPIMKKERLTADEIEAAACEKGFGKMERVEAVILGSNGKLCVLPKESNP